VAIIQKAPAPNITRGSDLHHDFIMTAHGGPP